MNTLVSMIYCFEKLSTDPTVCSGRGNCTYLNFCDCESGFSGEECQALGQGGIDIRSVIFGFTITGPVLAIVISICIIISFVVYLKRRNRNQPQEGKEEIKEALNTNKG